MTAIHTIFFDVGGTLVYAPNLFERIAETIDRNRKEEITTFLLERFKEHDNPAGSFLTVKENLRRAVRLAADKFGVGISSDVEEIYRKTYVDDVQIFPDVKQTLQALKERGVTLIVLSDADADVLREGLRTLEIENYFDDFLISSELGAYKPADVVVKAALSHCQEPLSGILFVGDSLADVETARKMGITSVHIRRGQGDIPPADRVIEELFELLK